MRESARANGSDGGLRIGAVSYLNAKPLIDRLGHLAPWCDLVVDLPSRLADGLAEGDLDVALVPSIECFRHAGYTVVSDACVACKGPVQSVKLLGRCPPDQIRTLALDEGSRTSAALAQILLLRRYGIQPQIEPFPIGRRPSECTADAVLLIGDRAIRLPQEGFCFVWDLGQCWTEWVGLPFVFAMWVARSGVDLAGLDDLFSRARDHGVSHLEQIARREAGGSGLGFRECLRYLARHLRFRLGPREREGLEAFGRLAVQCELVPQGVPLVFHDQAIA